MTSIGKQYLVVGYLAKMLMVASVCALGTEDITAVASRISPDYTRSRLSDGSFRPESYAFGEGGNWRGSYKDYSIDKLKFLNIAHTLAYPLAEREYIPSSDPKTTKLLIMVYWGTTHAPEHANQSAYYELAQQAQDQYLAASSKAGGIPGISNSNRGGSGPEKIAADQLKDQMMVILDSVKAEDAMRDKQDELNVMMLGYESWWDSSQRFVGTPLAIEREDLLDDIESNRYFVVLMCYDFQLLLKEKKHKLLWETRFSIRQMSHEFDKDLPGMAEYASRFFGKDSHGLVRTLIPLGHVEIGDPKSLGEVDSADKVGAVSK